MSRSQLLSSDEEAQLQNGYSQLQAPSWRQQHPWLAWLRTPVGSVWALLGGLLALACLISMVDIPNVLWFNKPTVLPDCVASYGGGQVGEEGIMPHFNNAACRSSLKAYSAYPDGPYWAELAQVAGVAVEAFKNASAVTPANAHQVIVFDIDETALSNMRVLLDASASWSDWLFSASAPAIAPVLDFYNSLYAAGYSVAFVTGRNEAERAPTAANLAAAGYGTQCAPASAQGAAGSAAGAAGAVTGQNAAGATAGAPGSRVRSSAPCYLSLGMRAVGDVRLASVYKPEKRGELVAAGYTILGSIGDEFSDLSGPNAAPLSFKLPNPFYFII